MPQTLDVYLTSLSIAGRFNKDQLHVMAKFHDQISKLKDVATVTTWLFKIQWPEHCPTLAAYSEVERMLKETSIRNISSLVNILRASPLATSLQFHGIQPQLHLPELFPMTEENVRHVELVDRVDRVYIHLLLM